ncbi:MAG TPA: SWIM zinc finger family protein [Micromonosporaceae bacterium]|nr:SWIM zinc finger family protein [Micromonosporaceae bacterium]
MINRWSTDQVLALAPDAASQKAARKLSSTARWKDTGISAGDSAVLWGLCAGSGSSPYQTCVDISGPAYRCSCPSRKFPCKHALALLLCWSDGAVPEDTPPAWVEQWQQSRTQRASATQTRGAKRTTPADPQAVEKRVVRRAGRVAAGLAELDRWLTDQIRQGIAAHQRTGYGFADAMAARLVDAQAPALAGAVRRLTGILGDGELWAARMLEELSLLRLLTVAYQRIDQLPSDLAATVRARIGFPVAVDEVLAGERVRDRWQVLGLDDEAEDQVMVRRVWLHGSESDRPALVLSFAGPGQALAVDLVPGTVIDAELAYYPGSLPLRAVVAASHGPPEPVGLVIGTSSISAALTRYAAALAAEPWLDRWPVLLADVTLTRHSDRWYLRDTAGDALPLRLSVESPWRLVATAGGHPVTLLGEWGTSGLRPVSTWNGTRLVAA